MKKILLSCLVLLLTLSALAQSPSASKVPSGSKIYISKMENDLDGFITTEIIKKKLPVTIVTEDTAADFILVGGSIKGDDKWYHSVFGGKDKNEGNVQLLSVKDKTVVWAGEAGDRSLWWVVSGAAGNAKLRIALLAK
jgi:hypothetical protein